MSAAAVPDPSVCADARRAAEDPGTDELSRRRAAQHLATCALCAPAPVRSHPSRPGLDAADAMASRDPLAALNALDAQLGRLDRANAGWANADGADGDGADKDGADRDDTDPPGPSRLLRTSGSADVGERVLGRLARHRPAATQRLRSAAGVLGVIQLVLSMPWLLGTNPWTMLGHPSEAHLTRDGALGVAAAVAGIVTAWRPRYAFSMLALCGAIIGMQVLGGAVDEHSEIVGGSFEAVHAVTLAIVVVVVAVALRRERPQGPTR